MLSPARKLKTNDSEYYSNLVNVRNIIYDDVTKALDIVRQFIVDNKLILVGGMAIDFALQLKGDRIYTDDQLPDYDFYSPNHAADAYTLGSMLCKAGFSNISCIQATHITTMKVRVDFEVVADITYCPLSVYKRIPTLDYNDLRIVHPHYQMIDQHSALAIPFENVGREVIFHRWKKDVIRYDKLYEYYPVVATRDEGAFFRTPVRKEPSRMLVVSSYKNPHDAPSRIRHTQPLNSGTPIHTQLLTGGTPIHRGYIRTAERKKLAKKLELPLRTVKIPFEKVRNSCISGWGAIDYKINKGSIELMIPAGEPVTVASYDYKSFAEEQKLSDIKYYSEYFGKFPRKILCKSSIVDNNGRPKDIEVYDVLGLKISAKLINEEHKIYVCNLQWAMLFLLIRKFTSPNPRIVFTAEEQYLRCRQLVAGGEYPSIEVYGTKNFTYSHINFLKKNKERIYNIKAVQLQPSNVYPRLPVCTIDREFDPETSEYFMTDARKMKIFSPWSLNPYPEYTQTSTRDTMSQSPAE